MEGFWDTLAEDETLECWKIALNLKWKINFKLELKFNILIKNLNSN